MLLSLCIIHKDYLFKKLKMTNLHLDNKKHNYLCGGENE